MKYELISLGLYFIRILSPSFFGNCWVSLLFFNLHVFLSLTQTLPPTLYWWFDVFKVNRTQRTNKMQVDQKTLPTIYIPIKRVRGWAVLRQNKMLWPTCNKLPEQWFHTLPSICLIRHSALLVHDDSRPTIKSLTHIWLMSRTQIFCVNMNDSVNFVHYWDLVLCRKFFSMLLLISSISTSAILRSAPSFMDQWILSESRSKYVQREKDFPVK